VVQTLVEAIVLVFLVMFLFLQNFRATIITTMTVPVVLLGTFGILAAAGFSINTLTMFGMVLAIGLLVDDAIVVVENVERVMAEEGLSPKEATKSMGQIQGALVGIALVLSAVLLPMAFFGGSTGVIYRQFSITIVSAMALSVLVALIFTPALCATMLKPIERRARHAKRGFFGWFNRNFDRSVRATSAAWATSCAQGAVPAGLRADRGRHDLAVHPHPNRVPAGRRPGRAVRPGADPGRLQCRAHPGGGRRDALPAQRKKRERWRRCSP
jgi:multidrug efflux pump subunit AcrB